MGWTTTEAQSAALIRSEIWSTFLKEILEDDLMAMQYVDWLTQFPDGDTFTIPSIGQATLRDYSENQAVVYDTMDTGEFQFSITEYVSSATYITKKMRQDAFYAARLESSFVPKQRRALMEDLETKVLALQSQQTAADLNGINNANHRFVAGNELTANVKYSIEIQDFARAMFALKKANVPQTNMIAIVDPSVEYTLNTLTNLVNVSNNPMWEGIITSGIATGMRFIKNVYGFDVYTSNYLTQGFSETINSKTCTNSVANMFFSAASDVLPFIGAWRQQPEVDGEYNKDRQREEYVTTARYGLKLYRPENLVTVLSSTDVVA
jgi:hypothetical protein